LNTILISTYTSSLWIFPSMNKTRLRLLTPSKQTFNLITWTYISNKNKHTRVFVSYLFES
jgi:hypothetical protein